MPKTRKMEKHEKALSFRRGELSPIPQSLITPCCSLQRWWHNIHLLEDSYTEGTRKLKAQVLVTQEGAEVFWRNMPVFLQK